ncbi:MAG: PIN domain-containing protein [Chloroflexia bacterium]|nr:PIN domain-containing protein [Chloroflexia bacterium]
MPVFYADSSVLVKRHVPERGSAWFRALTAPRAGHRIETARLSLVEVVSAFNRRVREGTLQPDDYRMLRNDFLARCRRTYRLVPVTNMLLKRTQSLLERHPLRTYDALHLASALEVNGQLVGSQRDGLIFLAADQRLITAALVEGLQVDNPNNYP